MPPINCTSKWRMLSTRRPASRTTAKASTRISLKDFLQGVVLFFLEPLLPIEIGFVLGFSRFGALSLAGSFATAAQPLLNALPEFVRLGAQFGVGELLYLRLKRIDGAAPSASAP